MDQNLYVGETMNASKCKLNILYHGTMYFPHIHVCIDKKKEKSQTTLELDFMDE